MTNLLQQLENNEAVLLMYLADELPAEERAEVDQLLSTDSSLRAEMESLRQAQGQVMTGLASLDHEISPQSRAAAIRQVSRAITRWQIEGNKAAPVAPAPAHGIRIPWWCYPLTAAAAIIVAFIAWSENRSYILGPVENPLQTMVQRVYPTPTPNIGAPSDAIEQDQLARSLFAEPADSESRELRAVALSRDTQDSSDLFGIDR